MAPTDGAEVLRGRRRDYQGTLNALVERNRTPHPYGAGRLDAFGHILNAVAGAALDEPRNVRSPDAPASYPFLWLTPKLEWVQWNGSAANPMGRNAGEVLGTFGTLNLVTTPDKMFSSSVLVDDLVEMEAWLNDLQPPAWPEPMLGALDPVKVTAGAMYSSMGRRMLQPVTTVWSQSRTSTQAASSVAQVRTRISFCSGSPGGQASWRWAIRPLKRSSGGARNRW